MTGRSFAPAKAAISRYARATSAGVSRETTLPNSHCPRAFFHTAVSKRRAGRTPPPREARNSRYARCGRSRAPGPKKRSLSARLGDSFYFAVSKIVESLLRRGARGDYPYELELRSSRAGCPYAGRAVPPGTRYGPFGRENSLWPRASEILFKRRTCV